MPIVYGVNYMNTQLQQEIQEARETFIGRIFTFGGSVLFLIGSFLAVVTAYKAYNRLLNTYNIIKRRRNLRLFIMQTF